MIEKRISSLTTGVPLSRRGVIGMLAAAAGVACPEIARAICAAPNEEGRWHNLDNNGNPALIEVKMVDCADQILNGGRTSTRYTLQCWVRQSNGSLYGRPAVNAEYRLWNGERWLTGRVPTGGFIDNLRVRAVNRGAQLQLHVHINHQNLSSNGPSPSSEFWFRR